MEGLSRELMRVGTSTQHKCETAVVEPAETVRLQSVWEVKENHCGCAQGRTVTGCEL